MFSCEVAHHQLFYLFILIIFLYNLNYMLPAILKGKFLSFRYISAPCGTVWYFLPMIRNIPTPFQFICSWFVDI